ncbi:MAG: ROK family protein, partial [Bacillota bacterium]
MSVIGIDLGGTNIRAGIVTKGNLGNVLSAKVKKEGSADEVIDSIFELIDQLKQSTLEIEGIGIGVPSVVDVKQGIVYDVQNIPSWKEVRLKDLMENRYALPVYINNDANCFAAGEKYFGKAKQYENAIGLIIGTGLG